MTLIPSRFTNSEAVEVEFELPTDEFRNQQTMFIAQVTTNFKTVPTTAGDIEIYYSDDQGEDLVWAGAVANKKRVSFYPFQEIPIPPGAKLIVRFDNDDSVETTVRIIWHF